MRVRLCRLARVLLITLAVPCCVIALALFLAANHLSGE